ncbi:MAG: type II toxin-antitoxin system prevent-host-death family antitoxin [Xenococcaceae cyanobacterium]
MLELHPIFLNKNGKNEFVVLPYEEFLAIQELLADLEDIQDLKNAKKQEENEPSVSLDEVKQILEM